MLNDYLKIEDWQLRLKLAFQYQELLPIFLQEANDLWIRINEIPATADSGLRNIWLEDKWLCIVQPIRKNDNCYGGEEIYLELCEITNKVPLKKFIQFLIDKKLHIYKCTKLLICSHCGECFISEYVHKEILTLTKSRTHCPHCSEFVEDNDVQTKW